ncbi:hypothetical protein PMAYCL1PPCAC_24139 [Pristionchus mayeri]|uniref:Uncharacterized protein n=1 Tax=Pristionchus mayeri TaxID=1317129 RepID=A0AAN5D089_9BILA|nr:hypothetical protein PMAYCL1PPCAC_24139 [Pristionchus mayeri]
MVDCCRELWDRSRVPNSSLTTPLTESPSYSLLANTDSQMPSMDSSLAAFDRLNLNESDVISHLCSVAVEKCQSKTERRLAGCGGHHMRKRVLIKNFVSELMKKQQGLQSEEGMEEEEGGEEEEGEGIEEEITLEEEDDEEEEEVDLNENMMMNEKGRREEDEDERIQRAGREWYQHDSPYSHSDGGYSSPSPPLDEDEREKSMWSMPTCTSPDSMALHLRDPYETREGTLYQSADPYAFSSSFSLSPPSDDESTQMGAPWHDTDLSSQYLARPPSRLDCSPPYSLYDDFYSSSPLPETVSIHYEIPTPIPLDASSIRVVTAGESDTAFLAMGGDRPLQEMRNYSTSGKWTGDGTVLFDLSTSSPPSLPIPSSLLSSLSSPPTPSKKRKSEEMSSSLPTASIVEDHSKKIKL